MELETALLVSERVRTCCQESKVAEEAGDFERARIALNEFWDGVGSRPRVTELAPLDKAEILLRAGTLTGKIGSAKQIEGAQELAKNLITESISIFGAGELPDRVAEAQTNMAYCYLREARFDDARAILNTTLELLSDDTLELKVRAMVLLGYVEREAKRLKDALSIHAQTAQIIDTLANDHLQGIFHNEYATVLKNLGLGERRGDLLDKALLEFTAAAFHFERCENTRYRAAVENNTGGVYLGIKDFDKALEHFDSARRMYVQLGDVARAAQVDENRARALLGQRRNFEALKVAKSAVQTSERGDEPAILAEALTTYGTCLARVNDIKQAESIIMRAANVAREAGDGEGAGRAWLVMLEELPGLSLERLRGTYAEASALLSETQDASVRDRLLETAGRVIGIMAGRNKGRATDGEEQGTFPENFSLADAKRAFEKHWIERAMRAANGNALQASRLLGLGHHSRIYQLLREYSIESMKHRTHAKSIITQTARPKVAAIAEMLVIDIPAEFRELPLTTHTVADDALNFASIRKGDEIVVWQTSSVLDGDLVSVKIRGLSYMVGVLQKEGDTFGLKNSDVGTSEERFSRSEFTIEGKIIGYCKGADVLSAKPGMALEFYRIG